MHLKGVIMICSNCSSEVPDKRIRKNQLHHYCNKKCKQEYYTKHNKSKYYQFSRSPSTTGAIYELMVCTELLKLGYDVFRSMSPNASCDLIINKNNILLKVEVTTGYQKVNNDLWHLPKNNNLYDILAVVTLTGIIYLDKTGVRYEF